MRKQKSAAFKEPYYNTQNKLEGPDMVDRRPLNLAEVSLN